MLFHSSRPEWSLQLVPSDLLLLVFWNKDWELVSWCVWPCQYFGSGPLSWHSLDFLQVGDSQVELVAVG